MVTTLPIPIFSTHAQERFEQRFPECDLFESYIRSVRVSYQKLMTWGKYNGRRSRFLARDHYRHDPETNCLFVISSVHNPTRPTVVTVWEFHPPPRKKR